MIVKLWDRTEFVVTNDQAELIKQAIREEEPWIEVAGRFMRPGAIAMIMPGGYTQADTPRADESRRIDAPDYRGRESPAKERLREALRKHDIGGLRRSA